MVAYLQITHSMITTPGDYNSSGILKSIYASGLRNPFRGNFDAQLNKLFIGEVGGNNQNFAWEDIHTIEIGQGGANFGWPACGDGSTGRESDGSCTNPSYTDPIFGYAHNGNGAAIMGGLFYRDFQYPISYQNKYFYGDYVRNWIKYLEFDNNLNVINETTFDSNPGLMLDFEVGPDGYLYYVRVLTAAESNIGTGEIRRYSYNDLNNSPPTCVNVSASPISGTDAPLSVDFSATVSDADGDTINYTWDFGDGSYANGVVPISGIIPIVNHQYISKGEKSARLYLTDQVANIACDAVTITIGQPPVAQILTPLNNSFFRGNDSINFTGQASDPDGIINQNNVEWYIYFYNGGTIHPRQGPDIGLTTSFTIPTSNHVPFIGNTGYIVTMSVTDSDGLTSTDSIFIQPEKSTITLNSEPNGLTVLLDGVQKTTPYTFDELINFKFDLNGPNQCLNDKSYTFSSWSDGGDKTHQIIVPPITTQFTANYDEFDECIICEKAIKLSGTGEQLSLVNNVELSGDFTIEFWAKLDINIGSADAPMSDGGQEDINFSQGKARLYTGTYSGSDQIASNFVATPDEWHHYAFVRAGNNMKVFVDGMLDKTKTITWETNFTIAKLGVAQSSIGFFDGELDEIRLWNIARSDDEIAIFYNKSIEPSTAGLEAYWSFNEEDDTQVIMDITGNGHNAVLGLNTSYEPEDPKIIYTNLIENDCALNYVYNNGWSPADPNGVSKLSNSIVIENGEIIINTDTFCDRMTVKPGAAITINSGMSLTTDSGMTLESSSTSFSSLILNGAVVGDIYYKRHVNNAALQNTTTGANDLISPPLHGQSFGDFRAANPNIFSGTIDGITTFLFGPFDNTTAQYLNYTSANDVETLETGNGYRTGSTDGSTYTFTGNVESYDVDVPITSNGASTWSLIGNPYPCYIRALDFLNNIINSELIDEYSLGIYGYDGEAVNGWTILNLSNSNSNTLIAPGQGFFINARASGNINFTPTMRTISDADDFIPGRSSENLTFLKLKASMNASSYTTDFYFNDNASLSLDAGYDATIWNDTPPDFSIYSHLIEDNTGKAIALQSLNSSHISNITIPLGVNANAGTDITFSIEESSIPNSVNVYIEDNATNTFTLLNSNDYQISLSTDLNSTGRFYLHFTENSLNSLEYELEELQIYANPVLQTIHINGLLTEKTNFELFDIQGRRLKHIYLNTHITSRNIDVSTLAIGVYIVKITNSIGKKTKKVIIK